MPSPKVATPYSADYFNLLNQSPPRFEDALRTLEKIKQQAKPMRHRSKEWWDGYVNAFEGMLTALKSKDDRAFIARLSTESAERLRREFSEQSSNPLQTDFDKGFFAAWFEYLDAERRKKRETKNRK